jgi:mannosyltransferase OCH1-like enzyme
MKLTKIPRNIFQTWETKDISEDFLALTQTWKTRNPNYAYFLYDDNDCLSFIKKHFDIRVFNAYSRIIPGAFKADLWRYCILYIYGGVYVDIDTICYNEIDLFLNEDIEFLTPIDLNNCPSIGTHNLFNAFIASAPKHPILLECINRVIYNIENNIIPHSNLDFSGPGILGRATNTYLNLNEETTFIGKQGFCNNDKVYFLNFECGTEYVKDKYNNILFQNKNGNQYIEKIYNEEIKKINHIDWGKCKIPIKPLPTIVTMIYNIREKENNNSDSAYNHKINKYFELAKKFILKLPYPLIIFTDDEELSQMIKEERNTLKEKTHIYNKKFEDTYFYTYKERLEELQKQYHIINGHLEHETPLYVILNNNKFDFMESAIELNPFNSTHFIWMDFGINHVAQNTEKIYEWIACIPDEIKQLCINPYVENVENKQMFQCIYHHTAGGLFTGSKENLLKYSELFKQKTQQIYNEEWYQIDEAVMTMVQRENPDLFDLFYGDYQGIISNYLSPINNISLILDASQKYINVNNTEKAFNILCYCSKYFENNIRDELVFRYIEQHIIADYYNNNRNILSSVIDLINLLKKFYSDRILFLLNNNKNNINFYENKYEIKYES